MRCYLMALGALLLAAVLPRPVFAQDPAKFFAENCGDCHTIGGGVAAGPDLKGVTARRDRDWLIRFLLDPEAFASDPVVVQMIKDADGMAMAATDGLTRELADAILTMIERQSAPGGGEVAAFAPFSRDEIALGQTLFTGARRLQSGGPACVACHSGGDLGRSAGGRLGPDLRDVHQRLGGGRGVTAWLKATQTPMMRALYRNAQLTEQEARALAAFTERPSEPRSARRATAPHVLGGLGFGALALGVIGIAGSRRFTAVRRPLVDRARRQDLGGSR